MKVIFMGTPDFAVPSLEMLIKKGYDVRCVVTQPDKPQGRKMILTAPPVKKCAQENGIEVFQPIKIKEDAAFEKLKSFSPDLIVVVAYGKILPKRILDLPKCGCINVHGSLLPKYRGAAPIQWSVIDGEEKTGVTTMYMDEGMDTGKMLLKKETNIGENETSEELYNRLSIIGAELLYDTIKGIESKSIVPQSQDESKATYAKILEKNMGKIDWSKDAKDIHNLIRGLNPWPIAFTKLNGKNIKIYKSLLSNVKGEKEGKIVSLSPLIVGCGNNTALEILEIQLEGKKRMTARDFVIGNHIKEEDILGEK